MEVEIWSDVNNRLSRDRAGDVKKDVNLEAVESAIENILMTRRGERVMRPEFGSMLEHFLMEPISEQTAYKIGLEVYDVLRKQEHRIDVRRVEVMVDESIPGYMVVIEAVLKELNMPFVMQRVLLV